MALGKLLDSNPSIPSEMKPTNVTRSLIQPSVNIGATKKDMKVAIRIQRDLWLTFVENCESRGLSASSEVRRFIESQVCGDE